MATNGIGCCILDLPCCKPPGSRVNALAKMMRDAMAAGGDCTAAAEAILAKYDLVPAGVGAAIGATYYGVIADAIRHEIEASS